MLCKVYPVLIYKSLIRLTMKRKLTDAFSFSNKLKQKRKRLRHKVMSRHLDNKSEGRRLLRFCDRRAVFHKEDCVVKDCETETSKTSMTPATINNGC